jgi:hypothetical protein
MTIKFVRQPVGLGGAKPWIIETYQKHDSLVRGMFLSLFMFLNNANPSEDKRGYQAAGRRCSMVRCEACVSRMNLPMPREELQ